MADAVNTNVLINTPTHYAVHLTNIGDGTGESAVIKADKSTLTGTNGLEPTSLDIEYVTWFIQGFTSVRLLWDHSTDDLAVVMPTGSGFHDFVGRFIGIPGTIGTNGLKDPRSTGGAGDILLTTNGGSSGATYDITIWLRKTN